MLTEQEETIHQLYTKLSDELFIKTMQKKYSDWLIKILEYSVSLNNQKLWNKFYPQLTNVQKEQHKNTFLKYALICKNTNILDLFLKEDEIFNFKEENFLLLSLYNIDLPLKYITFLIKKTIENDIKNECPHNFLNAMVFSVRSNHPYRQNICRELSPYTDLLSANQILILYAIADDTTESFKGMIYELVKYPNIHEALNKLPLSSEYKARLQHYWHESMAFMEQEKIYSEINFLQKENEIKINKI